MKNYLPSIAFALSASVACSSTPVTRFLSDNSQGLYVEVRTTGRKINRFDFITYKDGKSVNAVSYYNRDLDKNGLPDLKSLSVDCINRGSNLFGKDYYPGYRQMMWDTNGAMHISGSGECSIDLNEVRREIERKVKDAAKNGTVKN